MPFDRAALAQSWMHSHEEDRDGTQVFRPISYPFPPARGRDGLTLGSDGTIRRSIPGPDDKTKTLPHGSWKTDGTKLLLQHHDGSRQEFKIDCVESDKLVLQPL